jgi:hypothetical protein
MLYHNQFTKIFYQNNNLDPMEFSSVDEAKSYFFTAAALKCVDDYSNKVMYTLMEDEQGKTTRLKKTEGFDTSGIGNIYNSEKQKLIDSNNWVNVQPFYFLESGDHLF